MPVKFNPFTGQLQIDEKGSGGGSYIDGEVATYNDLPLSSATAPLNSAWLVRSSSGIWPFNKPAGIYYRSATFGVSRDADYTYGGTLGDVFSDSVFLLYDEASATRTGQFDLGSITAGQNRVLTWPDGNGTIARTADIPSTFAASAITSGVFDNARVNWAAPSALGSTTAAAATVTDLKADTLTMPKSGQPTILANVTSGNLSATGMISAATLTTASGGSVIVASGGALRLESGSAVVDPTDTSKKAALNLSGISTATTRTFSLPNASGTVALTSDIKNMTGATSSASGTAGLVPQPASGRQNAVLLGNATFTNVDKIEMLPDQLSDCVVWLRSDDLVTSGSSVTTWNNKVNSNKNAAQATATKQPTLQTNQINTYAAVRFDGTDDCLTIASLSLKTEITVFIVCKQASTAKPFILEHGPVVDSNDGFLLYGSVSAMVVGRGAGATNKVGRQGQSNYAGTSWFQAAFRFGSAPQNFLALMNLMPLGLASKPAATFTGDFLPSNAALSATLNIGARNDGAAVQSSQDFAEIIIYDRPLFDFEISAVSNYLKTRYAL